MTETMKRMYLYERLTEAIDRGISKAIDDDELFDTDDDMLNPIEDETEDSSSYTNHSKKYMELLGYVNAGWKFPKRLEDITQQTILGMQPRADSETRKFFNELLLHYDMQSDDVKKLIKADNVLLGYLFCINACSLMHEGFYIITIERKSNAMDGRYHFVSDVWYDKFTEYNRDGYAKVKKGIRWNLIDRKGRLLGDKWFTDIENDFIDGYAIVTQNGKKNYIDRKGKLLLPKWTLAYAGYFHDGYAMVKRDDGKMNCIDKKGRLLSDEWYKDIHMSDDMFIVSDGYGSENVMNRKGKLMSERWFNKVRSFTDGVAVVQNKSKWEVSDPENATKFNLIDKKGNVLSDIWFDQMGYSSYGLCHVTLNHKVNYIDQNGNLLSDIWFDYSSHAWDYGVAFVMLDGKMNLINRHGRLFSNVWYTDNLVMKEKYLQDKCFYLCSTYEKGKEMKTTRVDIDDDFLK